jgi:hypothetical protein
MVMCLTEVHSNPGASEGRDSSLLIFREVSLISIKNGFPGILLEFLLPVMRSDPIE